MFFCVFSRGDQPYSISFASANTEGSNFVLSDNTEGLEYVLKFDDDLSPADGTTLNSGEVLTLQDGSPSPTCSNGNNASINVFVSAGDINSSSPGAYTDTVTVLVSSI